MAALAAPTKLMHARASRASWERRQGCQRQGVHTSRREDNAHRGEDRAPPGKSVQPAEANRTAVQQAISSIVLARKRLTHREPTMRGYWYEEVRWQKSVQRIARGDVR
jgi:hypothetical protein